MRNLIYILFLLAFISCKNDVLPKPKAYLSLNYPDKKYEDLNLKNYPYKFQIPTSSNIVELPKSWMKIMYPKLKASIHITYRPVENNLKELLTEAEKLVFEHTLKADQISSNNYENVDKKVYGGMYDITGNSASQIQFHVTDSSKHFLKGSLFFHRKPNYDSILPAVDFIKKDMIHIMETLEWK